MSFRVIAKGHRFAIDGELNAAVRREIAQLEKSTSGGGPVANRNLRILHNTVNEFLQRAPHESDVDVDIWGESDAEGFGGITLKVDFTKPAVAAAPVEKPVTAKKALTEEDDE
jgi:hypothetical protein